MITIERLREIEPEFKDLSDEQLEKVRDLLYEYAKLAIDVYLEKKSGSKFPDGDNEEKSDMV